MAVSIDTHSLVLAMPARTSAQESLPEHPQLGDQVRLELSLPVSEQNARAKYLALNARVAEVAELNDGSRQVKFTFRKASFKDRVEGDEAKEAKPAKSAKPAGKGWRM